LPRLAVNWHVVEQFQVKYSYNTGYIRPSVGIGFLGQEKYVEYQENPFVPVQVVKRFGVSQSQEIASQDIQFIFSSGEFQGNLNFYYTQIDNPFQILAEDNGLLPPDRTVAFYVNTNKVTSKGMEIELAYKPSRFVELYANFSYVFDAAINEMTGSSGGINYDLNNTSANFGEGTFTPDGTMSGYPHIMFNTGINYFITDTLMGNLHLRFWDDMQMREPFIEVDPSLPDTVTLGSEYFVDFNLRYEKILGSNLDASLFVKNVLDNDDSLSTMLLFGTVWIDQGRRIGASLSYKF
jgi:outer membrane receptor protein involved in Fe transport